jgi:hypothetical protein
MKRARKTSREFSEDLRPEYVFDYSKARMNLYAARLKGTAVAVVSPRCPGARELAGLSKARPSKKRRALTSHCLLPMGAGGHMFSSVISRAMSWIG